MKKRTSIIALIIITIASCNPINKNTTWEYDGLRGEVKAATTIAYNVIDTIGQVSKEQIVSCVLITYNSVGKWTECRSFNPDGSSKWAEFAVYDNKVNIRERYDYTYSDLDSTLSRKFTYRLDKKGDVIESLRFSATDSLISKYVYEHDRKKMTSKRLIFNSQDSLTSIMISEYDKMDNLLKASNFDANDNLIDRIANTYDDKGNRTEKFDYNSKNELTNRTVYFYNENDFCSEIHYYNAHNSLERKMSYEYKYDSGGNWIEKIDYENDKAIKMTEKKIEYY